MAEIFDEEQALARIGGDRELLLEVAELFLEACPGRLSDIRQAIAEKEGNKLERAAHALKGAVRNFGPNRAFEAALALERIGRQGRLAKAQEACNILEHELSQLLPLLEKLGKDAAP